MSVPRYDKQDMLDVVEMESARMKAALQMAAQAGVTRRDVAKVMDLPSAVIGQMVHRWGINMETQ